MKNKFMSIFNIRVYGLLFNSKNQLLITDEFRMGLELTKFPGGGLIWGEGITDCLKREFLEELGCSIEIERHFYTTDYFQPSSFHKDHQVISIYYIVRSDELEKAIQQGLFLNREHPEHPFNGKKTEGAQSFRWLPVNEIKPEDFHLPIDKKVAGLIVSEFRNQDK